MALIRSFSLWVVTCAVLSPLVTAQTGQQDQTEEDPSKFHMFGVQTTLGEMFVVAILIWGAIIIILLYYVDYLKKKWAEDKRVRLTKDFSTHDLSTNGSVDNSSTSLYTGKASSGLPVVANSFNSSSSAKAPVKGSMVTRSMLDSGDDIPSLRL